MDDLIAEGIALDDATFRRASERISERAAELGLTDGHDAVRDGGTLVRQSDRFLVVEKVGRAGEIAETLDERT